MSKILIQGFLYDGKSSYQKGARLAPPLIRNELYSDVSNLFSENGIDINDIAIEDKGDFRIGEYFLIEKITKKHLSQGDKILTLGGDHSITYPIIKAFSSKYSKIDLLHIDAHADLYETYNNDRYSHACTFARIMEDSLVSNLTQIGIRTLNFHQREQAKKYNVEIIEMKAYNPNKVLKFNNPLYISIDIDALDPAYAPGVSHQEPGGFSSRELINFLHSIKSKIVGVDIVEYNPKNDVQNITAKLCSKLMKELLGKMHSS